MTTASCADETPRPAPKTGTPSVQAAAAPAKPVQAAPAGPVQAALAKVNAQCPAEYPEIVTQLPETYEVDQVSAAELVRMLESWSPAVRSTASSALASRGNEVMAELQAAMSSDSKFTRAGSASAMARIINDRVRNWQETLPGETDREAAVAKIKQQFAPVTETFIKLTRDTELEVRNAALGALVTLRPQTPEAAEAVVSLAWDEDVYLASSAVINFEKSFDHNLIERDRLIEWLKQAMASPFPRGKGHAFRLLGKLDDDAQRQLIPEMIAHLDWQPDRDTMFGSGGQADAVRLLTKFKVKELVPRLPALMDKTMRGPGLFEPCLESVRAFGQDAQIILPQLRAKADELEAKLETANARHYAGIFQKVRKIREAVAYVEGL